MKPDSEDGAELPAVSPAGAWKATCCLHGRERDWDDLQQQDLTEKWSKVLLLVQGISA